jgi:hypothetical protein
MVFMHANPRFAQLLDLADKGPVLRAALVEELAELLTLWPKDCPQDMRAPCEALLARAARDAGETVRAHLRMQLCEDPVLAARILPGDNLGRTLIEMTRAGLDIRARFAEALDLSSRRIEEILASENGLAVICKGLGIGRAVFSALVMLNNAKRDAAQCYALLDAYDAIPATEAARKLKALHKRDAIRRAA